MYLMKSLVRLGIRKPGAVNCLAPLTHSLKQSGCFVERVLCSEQERHLIQEISHPGAQTGYEAPGKYRRRRWSLTVCSVIAMLPANTIILLVNADCVFLDYRIPVPVADETV